MNCPKDGIDTDQRFEAPLEELGRYLGRKEALVASQGMDIPPINVLVVDDSRIMRNIVKNTFLTMNILCEFTEAATGKEALVRLKEKKTHLVLLDWNMPELSGLEFLKKVRAMDEYKELPIIMVTSEAAKYSVIEALKNGATDYIIKPVNEKIFKEKVSKVRL